jgi:uncharacterized protein YjiS (DUF1127 family)
MGNETPDIGIARDMRKIMKTVNLFPNSAGCIANDRHNSVLSIHNRIVARLVQLYQAYQKHRAWQRDLKHIAQFSPYLLRDIGLTAADIVGQQHNQPYSNSDTMGRPG